MYASIRKTSWADLTFKQTNVKNEVQCDTWFFRSSSVCQNSACKKLKINVFILSFVLSQNRCFVIFFQKHISPIESVCALHFITYEISIVLTSPSWKHVLYQNLRLTTSPDSPAAPQELLGLKTRGLNDSSHRVIRGIRRGPHESTAKKSPWRSRERKARGIDPPVHGYDT